MRSGGLRPTESERVSAADGLRGEAPSPARIGEVGRLVVRVARAVLTTAIFASFFTVSALLCLFFLPRLLMGRASPAAQARHRRALNRGMAQFIALLRWMRLLDYELPPLPAGHPEGGYLLVANHPSLLDVALLLAACPDAVCLVKAHWYRTPVMGPLLRLCDYVPGPGPDDELGADTPVLERIADKLREGAPVLVFPEGTRSPYRGLRRFHRGAVEAAVRAGAPIVPVFLDTDRPFLMKGQQPWHVPDGSPRFTFEWLEKLEPTPVDDSRQLTQKLVARYRERLAQILEQ